MRSCPKCGSEDLEPSNSSIVNDLGLSMPDNWHCNNCGYEGTMLTGEGSSERPGESSGKSNLSRMVEAQRGENKITAGIIVFLGLIYLIIILL